MKKQMSTFYLWLNLYTRCVHIYVQFKIDGAFVCTYKTDLYILIVILCLYAYSIATSYFLQKLAEHLQLQAYSSQYSELLAFKPTGWTYTDRYEHDLKKIKPSKRASVTIYGKQRINRKIPLVFFVFLLVQTCINCPVDVLLGIQRSRVTFVC